jgi:hypothetical protein
MAFLFWIYFYQILSIMPYVNSIVYIYIQQWRHLGNNQAHPCTKMNPIRFKEITSQHGFTKPKLQSFMASLNVKR